MKFKVFLTILKLFYLKLTGKIKKIQKTIEINQINKSVSNNVLIVFPIKEKAYRVALYSFRNFKVRNNTNYYFLINSIYKNHFHLSGNIYDMYYNFNKDKVEIDKYFNNEIIRNKKFDIVVDLNNEFLFDIAYTINQTTAYYKVGFKNSHSDYFYNIQLDLDSFDVLEKSYSKINMMLG
tara:strand:- start:2372 stop:2908 length:537 start_codon:yes stop_codon:yes gene_type:complete